MSKRKLIMRRSWKQFQQVGLLWWVNRMLHMFGWVIVYQYDGEQIVEVYPARTRFRGFLPALEEQGFRRLTRYLAKNVDKLLEESLDK